VLVGWRLKGWGRIGESLGECWVGVLRRRCWFKCRTNGGKEGCYCEGADGLFRVFCCSMAPFWLLGVEKANGTEVVLLSTWR
jgi:hypothetical protein